MTSYPPNVVRWRFVETGKSAEFVSAFLALLSDLSGLAPSRKM